MIERATEHLDALRAALQEFVDTPEGEERMEIPRAVLDKLADGADMLTAALVGGRLFGLDAMIAKVPRIGPVLGKAAIPALIAAAKLAGPKLREINRTAREKQDYLVATLSQFKLDLERGVSSKLLIRSPR